MMLLRTVQPYRLQKQQLLLLLLPFYGFFVRSPVFGTTWVNQFRKKLNKKAKPVADWLRRMWPAA